MRILIAGGGTAGHINPALSIANIIQSKKPDADILFIGTRRGLEKDLVPRSGYGIRYITVRGFERKLSFRTVQGILALSLGMVQAWFLLKKTKPRLVIGTGGYVSGPVLYWASRMKIPTLLHEQNAYPGITNRILSRHVDICAVSFEESFTYFNKARNVVLTGNPIRKSLLAVSRQKAREAMGLDETQRLVVVMGGSGGAKSINDACTDMLKQWFSPDGFRLVFAPGKRYYMDVMEAMGETPRNVDIREYIYDADIVYNACDLMVCRSGAITISEITAIGIPSVLVPSPNVTENHQEVNARALERKNACRVILDKDMDGKNLHDAIMGILKNPSKMDEMRRNARGAGILDADEAIYGLVEKLLGDDVG
ncbi:MAG: undecaprenyldiphospho-muramoylpentapeptide beta-N-acetylglucosaminyltransferase [Clostridia bacterium]